MGYLGRVSLSSAPCLVLEWTPHSQSIDGSTVVDIDKAIALGKQMYDKHVERGGCSDCVCCQEQFCAVSPFRECFEMPGERAWLAEHGCPCRGDHV